MRNLFLSLILALPLLGADQIYDAFESDGFGEWQLEGNAFGKAPVSASPQALNGIVKNYSNDYYVTSSHGGDRSMGQLTSPEFIIQKPYITFLISGGSDQGETAVQLLIGDEIVAESTGRRDLVMRPALWPVEQFKGQKARIRIIDQSEGIWGIINADHFLFSDRPNPKFPLTTQKGIPHEKGLVSVKEIPGLTIPEGSDLAIFANHQEHGLHSPTALTVDPQGRVYAVETHRFRAGVEDNRDHLYWLHDDLAAQTTDDRLQLHEKWARRKPITDLTANEEKIRLLIDTDGDGKADKTHIFASGFNDILDGTAAGIMALEGVIYFACIPNIYTLEDEDGDLVSDTQTILQDGFGVRVSFSGHDLNGFTLGPDGRIYCTIGDRGFSFTTKENRTYRYPNQGAILRFDPDGSNFQVVHTGLRNPKEIAFDKYGTAITIDNNSDQGDRARVVFMMEGGDSGWRMGHQVLHSFHKTVGIPERPINAWMAEKMWQPQNDAQPAYIVPPIANLTSGPSGLAYYPGTGYDKKSKDQFLICDYRGSAPSSGIWHFGIKPQGAGFALSEYGKFNWGITATDLEWGYDGRIYISDFIKGWTTHEGGRIYSLGTPNLAQDVLVISTQELIQKDFTTIAEEELADLLRHPDQRIRLRAQMHLAQKPQALAFFTASANQKLNEIERLHGIWGLGILARKNQSRPAMNFLGSLLEDPNSRIRAQAVKALGDSFVPDSLPLLHLLLDPDPRVQALTALAFSKHPHPEVYDQLIPLIEENNDQDPFLRHATSLCLAANVDQAGLAGHRNHSSASVRLAAVIALRRFHSPLLAQFLVDDDPRVADEAIRAIHDLSIERARPAIAALLDNYETAKNSGRKVSPMIMRRLIHSAFRLGEEKNVARLVRVAANSTIGISERLEALRLLSLWTKPPRVDPSIGNFAPLSEREITKFKADLLKYINLLFTTDSLVLGKTIALASQYGLTLDTLDTGTLTRLVRDQKSDAFTRTEALKLLMKTSPENPDVILTEAVQSDQDLLANTALTLAAEHNPEANITAFKRALESENHTRRQTAWKIVGGLSTEHAVPLIREGLDQLKRGQGDEECMLEIIEAARSRNEPLIDFALTSYEAVAIQGDPLYKWRPALAGGDPKNGKKLFQSHGSAQCMRCHRVSQGHSEGGEAGPNLMGVGLRQDAYTLLESLMNPSAKIAPRFGIAQATLKNGLTQSGLVMDDADTHIDLKKGETIWRIDKSLLKAPVTQTSGMPSMAGILKISEARDIVAWLLTLTKESGETQSVYETVPLTLSLKAKPEPKPKPETRKKPMSENTAIDPAIMQAGKKVYDTTCIACHQAEGKGMANVFPPVANSEWVNGPAENLIKIQLRGLQGPIEVAGNEYNGAMPPQATQSDETIASVLTYIRNSFGNSAPAVTPEMVAAHRDEVGKPMITVAELLPPIPSGPEKTGETEEVGTILPLPAMSIQSTLGASVWGLTATLIIGALCVFGLVRMKLSSD